MFATKQQVLDAFHFRCATRYYDPERKISKEDFDYILKNTEVNEIINEAISYVKNHKKGPFYFLY